MFEFNACSPSAKRIGLALVAATLPMQAWAHSAADGHSDVVHGMLHPVAGLDHLLVMVGVGLFAATLGGKARWLLPTTFVSVMALASVAAMSGLIGGSPAEHLIALSVLAIGLPIALALKPTLPSAMTLVALCAALHGHAHGVELPTAAGAAAFLVGFVTSTALLHATGALAGVALARLSVTGFSLVRSAGVAMALAGVVLLQS